MIDEMKVEIGITGFGSKLDDDLKPDCWANMPPELLTDILMRIEASECEWPARKSVVCCAAVCRSWRKNMKEIVKCPEVSGCLTFPSSLKQVLIGFRLLIVVMYAIC